MDNRVKASLIFTAPGIIILAALNLLFSPAYIWFYYAAYAALWWPLAVFFHSKRSAVGFALAGSAMTCIFLVIVNLQNSPGHPWFLYAVYPLVFWPTFVYLYDRGRHKELSVGGSILTIAYLILLNILRTPSHPWFLYALYPLLLWPVAVFLVEKAKTITFAWMASFAAIIYYGVLNLLISPGFPWVICIAFAVLWWPLSMFFARRRAWTGYSAMMSGLAILFLFALNISSSPGYLWAFFPAFTLLWWPLTMICARHRAWAEYSIAGALLLVTGFIFLNIFTTPGTIWAAYPVFAILWWPMSVLFAKRKAWLGYSFAGTALFTIFIIYLNRLTTPDTIWAIYPVFAALWWPMTMLFARRKAWLGYSFAGAALFTIFIIYLNRLTTPDTIWAIYPVFAVLWWPMSMILARRKNHLGFAIAGAVIFSIFIGIVNRLTSPGTIWAVFPVFAVLWWPLSVYFFSYRKMKILN